MIVQSIKIGSNRMPFIHIHVAGTELAPAQIETLQTEATRLMGHVMRKKLELTAVLIEVHPVGRWSIGGVPVPRAAHLDAKVTAGTNSADEKSQFIRQAHELLTRVVGGPDLPLATYVVVDEVPADAWDMGDGRSTSDRNTLGDRWPGRSRGREMSAADAVAERQQNATLANLTPARRQDARRTAELRE